MESRQVKVQLGNPTDDLDVVILEAGPAKGLHFGPAALQAATALFERAPCFVDHGSSADLHRPGGRSVRDLAGFIYAVRFDPIKTALVGKLHIYAACHWLTDLAHEAGHDHKFGLSADLWVRAENGTVEAIESVASVDVVMNPAAGGRFILPAVPDPRPGTNDTSLASHKVKGAYGPKEDTVTGTHHTQLGAPGDAPPAAPDTPPAPDLQKEVIRLKLQVSKLPTDAIASIQSLLGNQPTLLQADRLIEEYTKILAQAQAGQTVKGLGRVTGMRTSLDRIELAFHDLMGMARPDKDNNTQVRPLTGIREMYDLLTGDWERRMTFHPERVTLANATITTMAQITANVLNKILLRSFEIKPQWWSRVAYEEDFPSMNDVKWIAVGGFSDLSTVLEGAAYTEKTWDDYYESSEFIKKGNYIGVTIEMIDRDDVSAMKSIPRRLGFAAYRTLSTAISSLFTSPDYQGVVLSDGDELFKSADEHSNYTTAALSGANWQAAITKMFKQTEYHSAKRLGIRPRYCMIPIDLEKTALEVFTSDVEPVATHHWKNVLQRSAESIVIVPDWTDTTDWVAAADPNELEGLCVGYRYGRTPELFVADQANVGSMFTNDELRIKVRFVYTVGIGNYRALQKSHQ